MIHRLCSIGMATMAVMLMGAAIATAQVPWPCPNALVHNATGCKTTLTLNTTPPGVIPPIPLAPGQFKVVPTPVMSIDQVVTAAGALIPILPPPPPPMPPCACGPTMWSACCLRLPGGCCFDVCFDPGACTITLMPAACPPAMCQP